MLPCFLLRTQDPGHEVTEYSFKTLRIKGQEGMVRGMFQNRNLQGSAAAKVFPGVPGVAILPKTFASEAEASDYLQALIEQGGNAAAVRVSPEEWFIGAWVSSSD